MARFVNGQKYCPCCDQYKDPTNFYKHRGRPHGIAAYCKLCEKARPKHKGTGKGQKKKTTEEKLNTKNYGSYRSGALRRKKSFNITKEQFVQIVSLPCLYCGLTSGGIDRKNNNVGYEIENCVPCCKICNFMKHTLTTEVFIAHIKLLASRF